ncbi:unnamed protein product [Mesocestoides corti]|nr:unnamed protein product [Mesocestoides corti]
MQCTGVLYDRAGVPEVIEIAVPVATGSGDTSSSDMIQPLAELRQQINETITAKIGSTAVKQDTPDDEENQADT